jgi:ATP-dependent DNA ligase
MYFSTLATYFDKLEANSSRLTLIDILAELFKHTTANNMPQVIYLLQGRIAPFFEPVEIGMADKTVSQAIADAYKEPKEKVWEMYQKAGDIGLVVAKLSAKCKVQSAKLSVQKIIETLAKIANTSGDGTVEKRVLLFENLLEEMDDVEAKHFTRITLGNTRLGIGDPTILDALALAVLGDRSKRKLLEKAYNETSDLGLIGKTLLEGGLKAVGRLGVTVGRPIRSELCERLPNAEKVFEKMTRSRVIPAKTGIKGKLIPDQVGDDIIGVHTTPKYDGFRCVTGFTPIYIKDKGIISIKDIKVGDLVLTKTGYFKKILAKHKRTINKKERLFKFRTYLGDEIRVSEGHPLLCLINGREVWRNIENIKYSDEVVFPLPTFPPNNPHPALQMLDLQTRSGYKKTFIMNDNFYRFLGFWIGDGFTNDFHNTERVGITFNAKTEQKLADFYESIVNKDLQISEISRYTHNGGLNLYWRDEPLKQWLSTYFRRDWVGKMLPQWFSHISKKHFEQFLKGWIESDGTDKDGTIYITTKERDLAAFAQLIGLSHGFVIGLHYIRVKIKTYHKTYYQLVIPKTHYKARVFQNKMIIKVKYIEEIKYRDPRTQLYDIQVEDDESFCVPMATLHNCQIHKNGDKVEMFSRNLEDMTKMFPELIKGTLKQVKAKTAILDTEALAYQPESEEFLPFQETTKRRRKYKIEEMVKSLPLKAFVFDILYLDGKSLIDKPLLERMEALKNTIHGDEILIPALGKILTEPQQLQLMLDDSISKGLEGVVVKRVDSLYEAGGRNFNWVKLKRHSSGELSDTIDCVILGYIFGKGKRTEFGAGALLVGVYDKDKDEFVTVSKIGTGLTDEEWISIKQRTKNNERKTKPVRVNSVIIPSVWVEPKLVIEVLADEITRSPIHTAGKEEGTKGTKETEGTKDIKEGEAGYALRFPRLVSFRDKDKKAEDATTVKELIELYKEQGKK